MTTGKIRGMGSEGGIQGHRVQLVVKLVCVCVLSVCKAIHAMTWKWPSEKNFGGLVISFHIV